MEKGIFFCVCMMLFSVFGSCVKWMHSAAARTNLLTLGIEAVTAAFSGILMYCVYIWTNCNEGLAFILAGMSGYYGTKGIDTLGKYIVEYLRLEKHTSESQPTIVQPGTSDESQISTVTHGSLGIAIPNVVSTGEEDQEYHE